MTRVLAADVCVVRCMRAFVSPELVMGGPAASVWLVYVSYVGVCVCVLGI